MLGQNSRQQYLPTVIMEICVAIFTGVGDTIDRPVHPHSRSTASQNDTVALERDFSSVCPLIRSRIFLFTFSL